MALHKTELHPSEWCYRLSKLLPLKVLLTGNSEAGLSLLWTGLMHVKDAGVAAFVTEAHPADDDSRGVFWGGCELNMLLSAHTVSLAGLVGQQCLVLDINPSHLPQRLTSIPRNSASQSEGLVHWSFQTLWCRYLAWNMQPVWKIWCDLSSLFEFYPSLAWHTHPAVFPPSVTANTPADLSSSSSSLLI